MRSSCRGTKAALGGEAVVKPEYAGDLKHLATGLYDGFAAERSLVPTAAAMYGLAPTVYLLLKNCRPVASMY